MRIGGRSQSAAAGAAILLFSVACTDALGPRHGDVAPPHSVTGSGLSLSLVGANIVRHKPIPGEVQTKSRDEILKLLEQIKAGVFGDDVADMLAARQQNATELADEDVQALLQATLNRRQPDKD